jgi:hypothetical protein
MADLKIKATSGNLVLADDGGDAAITVASNGTTTFAENATLSGSANNLGTVTAGTIVDKTVTDVSRKGNSCRMYLTNTIASITGNQYCADHAMSLDYNDDATLYSPQTSAGKSGIKILVAGTYLFTWSMYTEGLSDSNGYVQQYLSEVSSSNVTISRTYYIFGHDGVGTGGDWHKPLQASTLQIAANQIINTFWNRSSGSMTCSGGDSSTFLVATYLHD